MKGFKNSTRTQYMKGGSCEGYAKGGSVKGAAKIAKVMGEFKSGTLHSGSKKGPEVTSKKQATAIALSEARKAGAKIPQPVQKKFLGGVMRKKQAAEAANFANTIKGFNNTFGENAGNNFNLASDENGMKKGGKVIKKDVGGPVAGPRQARVDNKAANQAARADAREARVAARADRMAARDARQEANAAAQGARREAAQARQASVREAVNAATPARGPGGAGFNARPAFGAGSRQREVQPAQGQTAMKKGGSLSAKKYEKGGAAKKIYTEEGGNRITIPVGDIPIIDYRKRVTYEPEIVVTAPKAKVDEARRRRALGSEAEIIARGNRSQALEAMERRALLGFKKGGLSAMPKGKGGKC